MLILRKSQMNSLMQLRPRVAIIEPKKITIPHEMACNNCTAHCGGTCSGSCYGFCVQNCGGQCTDTCALDCDSECSGSCRGRCESLSTGLAPDNY